jgi:putative restriction endonuclease
VFNLYCRTPFGKLHRSNPDVISLSRQINRTPSAVAMKLVNFASFDPVHQARQVRGLRNASRIDGEIWDEFNANPEQLAFESQQVLWQLNGGSEAALEEEIVSPKGPTETTRLVRARLVQGFFRDAVLSSYEFKCSICRIDLPEILSASHIIPWSKNVERRADPRNGLCLCALHDRAFDRGLLSIDGSFHVILSSRVKSSPSDNRVLEVALREFESEPVLLPRRFVPDPEALAYHREHIFRS